MKFLKAAQVFIKGSVFSEAFLFSVLPGLKKPLAHSDCPFKGLQPMKKALKLVCRL